MPRGSRVRKKGWSTRRLICRSGVGADIEGKGAERRKHAKKGTDATTQRRCTWTLCLWGTEEARVGDVGGAGEEQRDDLVDGGSEEKQWREVREAGDGIYVGSGVRSGGCGDED